MSRRDELEAVASPELAQHPDLYLSAARPPVLKDYFDERLRVAVRARSIGHQIQVAAQSQTIELPIS